MERARYKLTAVIELQELDNHKFDELSVLLRNTSILKEVRTLSGHDHIHIYAQVDAASDSDAMDKLLVVVEACLSGSGYKLRHITAEDLFKGVKPTGPVYMSDVNGILSSQKFIDNHGARDIYMFCPENSEEDPQFFTKFDDNTENYGSLINATYTIRDTINEQENVAQCC